MSRRRLIPVDARRADWPRLVATAINELQNDGAVGGYVSSVGLTAPTGFTVVGSPVTSSGTFALTFSAGYSLPTDAAQANWNTAYGWGDHALAGYLDAADIGVSVQAYGAGLTDIAGLAVTDGNIIVGNGTNWVAESGATARASLGLTIGTDVQAQDAFLQNIADLAPTAGEDGYSVTYDHATTSLVLSSVSGGGISDGDKGDITVSSSGTVWNIDAGAVDTAEIADDAVTAAKLADTAVTPGSYTNTDLTVDAQGRITAASSGTAGSGGRTLIGEATSAGSVSTLTVSSIPGTYTTLEIEVAARSTTTGNKLGGLRFNGDSTSNYNTQRLGSDGASSSDFNATTTYSRWIFAGSDQSANVFSKVRAHIPDYADTAFRQVLLAKSMALPSSAFDYTTLWGSTAAITQIDLVIASGNLAAGSYLRVYGI